MKTNKIFATALAVLALAGFTACEQKNQPTEVTGLTLDQTTLTLEVNATATLVATVEPAGAATVTWVSQNPQVATVDDGVVTGVTAGNTIIVATAGSKTATCLVSVGAKEDPSDNKFAALLTGSDYYVFALDDVSFEKLGTKVKGDFRMNGAYGDDGSIPAETTSVLEIWGQSFAGGQGGGLNCFGAAEGYISLVSAQGEGWGLGCGGLRQIHRTIDLTAVTADHTLAIAYKCPANNAASAKAKFTLYSTKQGSPEVAREVSGNTAGEWTLVEYSMADLFAAGLDWTAVADCQDGTYAWYTLGILIEGIGQGLDVDAILVYKK